jgi:hypothetical protein
MTTPPRTDVPIRSDDDLTRRWAELLEPPVFGARSRWLSWLDDDGRMIPLVVPVDDVPAAPDARLTSGVLYIHAAVTEEHLPGDGHLVMALCRPGGPEVTEDDDAWIEGLQAALDDQIDGTWSLHLAAAGRVSELAGRRGGWPRR